MVDGRANHDGHDLELVAMWAAGEATGVDLDRAERLLDACDLCVGTARDLRAITLELQSIPAVDAAGALPPAPRDFRLTPEQAARLRPSAPLVRWTDRVVAGVAAFGRPVGASLATLGLVGLLVGAATLGPLGGSAASAPKAANAGPTAAPAAPAASPGPAENSAGGAEPAMTKGTDVSTAFGPAATQAERQSAGGLGRQDDTAVPGPTPTAWLLAASLAALIGGLALVVIATRRG